MKLVVQITAIFFLLAFELGPVSASTLVRELGQTDNTGCESDVVVQADDWLSKIADKFFGDIFAFPAIVEATNAKAEVDDSYNRVEDPDIIEIGWKLCIPNLEDAQAVLSKAGVSPQQNKAEPSGATVPAPELVEYNGVQFVWVWEGLDTVSDEDWYFDIKVFHSVNEVEPYATLVAEPDSTQYLNGKWYSDLTTNFQGCSYWVVQIAIRDTSGKFVRHISPESERLKIGDCEGSGSTFSSPI